MSELPERLSIETSPPNLDILSALQELLPGVVADGVIDAQRISNAVGVPVAGLKDGKERFGMMWAGKSDALKALQTPSLASLSPDLEASINFDLDANPALEEMASMVIFLESPDLIISIA